MILVGFDPILRTVRFLVFIRFGTRNNQQAER